METNTPNIWETQLLRPKADPKEYISHVFRELSNLCARENDKWNYDPVNGNRIVLNKGERIALMHAELSEALEGLRKDKMDDHLTHRKAVEVELADLLIRVLHFSGDEGLDLGGALVEKLDYNRVRADHTDAARASQHGKRF